MVACESLLGLFFILFWATAILGFKNRNYWPAAGFFACMTFLTKSIGILTIPIFFFSGLMVRRKGEKTAWADKRFWAFFLVFFIFALPLFARNLKVFGSPFYSNSSAVLWIDRWHDYNRPGLAEHPPTAADYLKTHSAGQVIKTFAEGILLRNPRMIVDGLKPFAFWHRKINPETLQGYYQRTVSWQEGWACLLMILCVLGFWGRRKTPEAAVSAVTMILFLVFVGWYSKVFPGSPPTRLLYPILFLVIIFASAAALDLGGWILSKLNGGKGKVQVAAGLGIIFIFFYLGSLATHYEWKTLNINKSYAFNRLFAMQLRWVADHARPNEPIMVGAVFAANIFYFRSGLNAHVIEWPQADSLENLTKYIEDQGVKYGLLDIATVAYNMPVYGNYFEVGPKTGLRLVRELPAPFVRIPRGPGIPPLYEIYEFTAKS
jgi:hypothetical protein